MRSKAQTIKAILSDPEKRRAWIIWQLSLKNMTCADLAREQGVTRNAVYAAFTRPYPKMEAIIAKALGMAADKLFPERYTNGVPNRVIGRPKKKNLIEKTSSRARNSGSSL
jgi:Ner family transcriptional regulator